MHLVVVSSWENGQTDCVKLEAICRKVIHIILNNNSESYLRRNKLNSKLLEMSIRSKRIFAATYCHEKYIESSCNKNNKVIRIVMISKVIQ